jgi:hypothetical protein
MNPRKRYGKERTPGIEGRFIKRLAVFIKCPAYRTMSGEALKLLDHFELRFNGENNGEIHFSVREAAALLSVSINKAFACFRELQRFGAIRISEPSGFNRKDRFASTWWLTFHEPGAWPLLRWKSTADDYPVHGVEKNTVLKTKTVQSQNLIHPDSIHGKNGAHNLKNRDCEATVREVHSLKNGDTSRSRPGADANSESAPQSIPRLTFQSTDSSDRTFLTPQWSKIGISA